MYTEFGMHTDFATVVSDYSNPYALQDVTATMFSNIKLFFTSSTPLYYLLMFVALAVSIALIRFKENQRTRIAPTLVLVLSVIVAIVFMRTPGWFRYLFPGIIPLLVMLPSSLSKCATWVGSWFGMPELAKKLSIALLCVLVAFQFHQTIFSSWVSQNYSVQRNHLLTEYFAGQDANESVFFYNVPEAAIYARSSNYYQYMHITDALVVGESQLARIHEGVPESIVLSKSVWNDGDNALGFDKYRKRTSFGSYTVLEKVN